jgi:S1-C subfamily serine protease
MTGVDWVIACAVVLLAGLGWASGFLSGALSLLGFAAGAWVGTRLGPLALEDGSRSPSAPLFGLAGAVLAGIVLATGFEGIGSRLRGRLRSPGLAAVDGILGALLTAAVGVGLAWLLGAIALMSGSPEIRRAVQRSLILAHLNDALPPSGPLLNALARFDPLPRVEGPEVDRTPPRGSVARDRRVRDRRQSVVKVLGSACGLGVEGSGWVAGNDVVVTNAHVVAGQDDTRVLLGGEGDGLPARAVRFDARNDLAVLHVDGLGGRALRLAADPAPGTTGAILGFPLNGPFDVRAARIGVTRRVLSEDSYGRGPVARTVTALRGRVRSGNSGGPVVDRRGRVLATVFAATISGPRGGYGVPNAVVRDALRGVSAARPVSTGPCTR